MSLTFQAALREAEKASDEVPDILERAAQGALMGARGNSGVIVSQFFRGFARAVGKAQNWAFQRSPRVSLGPPTRLIRLSRKPVEGTILTVVEKQAQKPRNSRGKSRIHPVF